MKEDIEYLIDVAGGSLSNFVFPCGEEEILVFEGFPAEWPLMYIGNLRVKKKEMA